MLLLVDELMAGGGEENLVGGSTGDGEGERLRCFGVRKFELGLRRGDQGMRRTRKDIVRNLITRRVAVGDLDMQASSCRILRA